MNGTIRRRRSDLREQHERQILDQLESSGRVTQRSLSSDLGIALGLTNLLMRRLVKKGWVRVKRVSPRRIRYLITPAGVAAKARLTREYLLSTLTFYRECRQRVGERLAALGAELQRRNDGAETTHDIVFHGVGEIAEVAYVCLQETRLTLLGVVDQRGSKSFFHLAVHPTSALTGNTLAGRPFSMLVVMPFQDEAQLRHTLAVREVPLDHVFWL